MFKSLTPLALQRLSKAVLAVGVIGVLIVTLGPFQNAEEHFGFTDKEAHALAFYAISVGLFLCAPRRRRVDLALMVLALGVGIEVMQSLVGRDGNVADAMADSLGIFGAVLPGLVERLRHHVRVSPYITFEQIAATDRRRKRAAQSSSAQSSGGQSSGGQSADALANAKVKARTSRAKMKAAPTVHVQEGY